MLKTFVCGKREALCFFFMFDISYAPAAPALKNYRSAQFFAISAAVPLGGRGAATPHKSFSPSGGKRKSGVWCDEVPFWDRAGAMTYKSTSAFSESA